MAWLPDGENILKISFIFCLPWGGPCGNHTKRYINEKTIRSVLAKRLAACTHLSSTASQLFEPQVQKIAVFTYRSPHFLFPLETPLRVSRNMLHGWKDNSMLAKPLAASTVPIYVQQFPSYSNHKCKKIAVYTYRSAHFCFPWGCPWGNHAKCYMDGKRIRCLQIASLNVPI